MAARDTLGDVGATAAFGTEIRPPVERSSLQQVAVVNAERVKQALRAIEEYARLLSLPVAQLVGAIRYEWYTLEKACNVVAESGPRLSSVRLYVLIDGGPSECAFAERAQTLIEAGVDAFQFRDKKLDDRTLLARARLLRRVIDVRSPLTAHQSQRPLLILNDRADLAVLARADGVHVGQDELEVRDVRRIVGPQMLIGVSTHSIEQARRAVLDGANYIGCGPVFPSYTKHFDDYPGVDFLRQVAAEISLPAFAIGGITRENLALVLSTGCTRVAVSGAITTKADAAIVEVASILTALRVE
jgi:thiamine-phosphate pyrophosphorylase